MNDFPQILLLGNGLNRAYGGADWSALLNSIHTNQKVSLESVKVLPFPFQAVLLTGDRVDKTLTEKPELFRGVKDIAPLAEPLERLLSLPFDHILTTNYSYELERVACGRGEADGRFCRRLARHTDGADRAEARYLLHTYNAVSFGGNAHKLWHIHGEARKPQSIVLGHYYYGKLLGKIQAELNKRGNEQHERQRSGKPPLIRSWPDAFIMGDVYVLGFGFDFSEMDLWWLLNRKKREKADHGKLVFYSPQEKNETKLALMDTYGAEIESLGYYPKCKDYRAFYEAAIEDIRNRMPRTKP